MKRNYIPFATGMVTMLLLVGAVGASLAKETAQPSAPQSGTLNGQVAYGEAGVALFGKEQVQAGATRTTEKGALVPTVLTYTDEKGETHYFVNAETTAEVLDVSYGVIYRPDLNCVDFGTTVPVDEQGNPLLGADGKPLTDQDGNPLYWSAAPSVGMVHTVLEKDGTERIIGIGNQESEIQMEGGISVTVSGSVGASSDGASEAEKQVMQKRLEWLKSKPTTPEYGVTNGIFTEVDPAEMDKASYLGRFVDQALFQAEEVEHTFAFLPELKYAAIVIENLGEEDILVGLSRPCTVGDRGGVFSEVRIPAGKTLTRAFRIENSGSADLQNKLSVGISSVDGSEAQVRLSSEQYSRGVEK